MPDDADELPFPDVEVEVPLRVRDEAVSVDERRGRHALQADEVLEDALDLGVAVLGRGGRPRRRIDEAGHESTSTSMAHVPSPMALHRVSMAFTFRDRLSADTKCLTTPPTIPAS